MAKHTPGAAVTPAIIVNEDRDPKHAEDEVRGPTNYDRNAASRRTALHCKDPSLTAQEFAEEVDINFIADRFGLTGELPNLTGANAPTWGGNFTEIFDFQSAQNAVAKANQDFMLLPADLRSRFDNNPAKLLDALRRAETDPKERAVLEAIGLLDKKPPTESLESPAGAPDKPKGQSRGAPSTPDGSKGKKGAPDSPSNPPKPDTE